ncbi:MULTISPECIES: hypothetical protein [Streptomyces]|uniref:hypothetical protein n=1 Tax=Streptomyces TaxID=1883 RepID=UPI002E1741BF
MPHSVPDYPVSEKKYIKRILRHSPRSLLELIAATSAAMPFPRDLGRQNLGMYGPWALADAAWISLAVGGSEDRRGGGARGRRSRPQRSTHRRRQARDASARPQDLDTILGYYLALDDPISTKSAVDHLTNYLLRVAGQQFTWQVDEYSELARTIALLEQTTTDRHLQVLHPGSGWDTGLLGCTVPDYVSLARLVWGAARMSAPQRRGRFVPGDLESADFAEFGALHSVEVMTDVLERHFVTTAPRLCGTFPHDADPLVRRYGFNPVRATPLVEGFGEGYLVPVPAAVLGKASLLGLYYTGVKALGNKFADDLGELFEQYVGRQLRLLPDAEVHPEVVYALPRNQEGKSVDWMVVFPDLVLLVEVKSTRPNAELLLGPDGFADLDILKKRVGKGFQQIETSAERIAEGHVAFAHIPRDRPVLGMIVTMEPFHLINTPELRAAIEPTRTPVTVSSIHEVEQAVTITDVSLAGLLLASTRGDGLTLQELFKGHQFTKHNAVLERAWESIPMPRDGRG